MMLVRPLLAASLLLATAGCGGPPSLRPVLPAAPSEQSKCKVAASQQNPLVTEWPASEKANLEARLREGGVVVAYSGCSMRLLPACRVKGSYTWRRTTTATDTVEVHDADELYAKLPLGAAALEGELQRSGRIAVQTTVSGQLNLTGLTPEEVPEGGSCAGATHVVGALSVGAFKLKSGGAVSLRAEAGIKGIATAGGSTKSEESLVRDAGDPQACRNATEAAPDAQCGSPIQIFLQPLPSLAKHVGPPGTIKVRFVSTELYRKWKVMGNDGEVCTTPCDRWIDPATALAMRSEDGFLQTNTIPVPDLRLKAAGPTPLEVQARPASFLRLAGGLTLVTFGGLSLAGGAALAAVGVATKDNTGMRTAGAVVIPLSLGMLIPGIVVLTGAGARAEVKGPSEPGVAIGPGFASGRF